MAHVFGTGLLCIRPSGSNPTPIQVGVLKDVTVDISFTEKELRGEKQFPLAIARASGKLSAKAKSGTISGSLIHAVLAGATLSTGSVQGVQGEAASVPNSPFEVTVTHGANFKTDFGVYDKTAKKWMTRGATASATGIYSVDEATGKYTFNTQDATHAVTVYYSWNDASTGKTIKFTNQLMGAGTTFTLHLFNQFDSKSQGVTIWAATCGKLGLALKQEDFGEKDLEFSGFDDGSGNIIDLYTAD